MKISRKVVSEIQSSFKGESKECGGLLGAKDGIICAFLFDKGSHDGEYYPDVALFNKALSEWAKRGIYFGGIIHSHPNDCRLLSSEDEKSIKKISEAAYSDEALYFPILTLCGEKTVITSYKYENGRACEDTTEIVN